MKRTELPLTLQNSHVTFNGTLPEGSFGAYPKGSQRIACRLGLPAHFMLAHGQRLFQFDGLTSLSRAVRYTQHNLRSSLRFMDHSLNDAALIVSLSKEEFNMRSDNTEEIPQQDPLLLDLDKELMRETRLVRKAFKACLR